MWSMTWSTSSNGRMSRRLRHNAAESAPLASWGIEAHVAAALIGILGVFPCPFRSPADQPGPVAAPSACAPPMTTTRKPSTLGYIEDRWFSDDGTAKARNGQG